VRVETADGFVGWGESTLEGHTGDSISHFRPH
jgi:L-alanine-DL-glutamate epimerase-like enolase superfamily enzyme